jgi:gas vesicle protein
MNIKSRGLSAANSGNATSADTNDLTKVLIGALAGAAVGSLVGGAFTQKGIEIRSRVGEGSKNIANSVKDKVSDMTSVVSDKYQAVKEGAADLFQRGKQKVGMSSADSGFDSSTAYTGSNVYTSNSEFDESGSGSNILLGALIVSVAGTIVWSFATEKGNRTRRRIAEGSKNMASNIKDKVSDVAGGIATTISDTYQSAKEGVTDMIEKEQQRSNMGGNTANTRSTAADNW